MKNKATNVQANPQKWVELYGDLLYKYTVPRVTDSLVAEDLVQDTFLSALKGLQGFKGEASEKNWLFTILKHKIIDHYRKKTKERKQVETQDLQNLSEGWFTTGGRWNEGYKPKDWHPADGLVERKEFQNIINLCKEKLKALQQQVFTLKYMEEINSDEICKVLDISASNYWVLLHRVRLQMRDCVEKNWLKS